MFFSYAKECIFGSKRLNDWNILAKYPSIYRYMEYQWKISHKIRRYHSFEYICTHIEVYLFEVIICSYLFMALFPLFKYTKYMQVKRYEISYTKHLLSEVILVSIFLPLISSKTRDCPLECIESFYCSNHVICITLSSNIFL